MSQPEMPAREKSGPYWLFIPAAALSVGLFGAGVAVAVLQQDWSLLAGGLVALVVTLLAWPVVADRRRVVRLELEPHARALVDRLDRIDITLRLISEQQLVSDRAKQVAFREKDRDAFRRAIQEDIAKQDYDAALALVDEIDQQFGYRTEAERLRQEVLAKRDEQVRRQLDVAINGLDRHIQSEQWQLALREAERIRSAYPTQPRAQNLVAEIEQRRSMVKRELLATWSRCVAEKRIDDAIDTLKQLDSYLTPVESAALEEDARMIFREKLNKLRLDFTGAVHEGRTREAIRIGQVIINDFPNSQMSSEIRERMPLLEARLKQEQDAQQLAPV